MNVVDDTPPQSAIAAAVASTPLGLISNGTVALGLNPEGHLNLFESFVGYHGLEFVPTGGDALALAVSARDGVLPTLGVVYPAGRQWITNSLVSRKMSS